MQATSSRPPTRRASARARHRAIAVPRSRRLASWWGGPVVARLEGLLFDQRHGEARTGRVGARVPARAQPYPTGRAISVGSSRHLAARMPHESPLTARQPPIPHEQRDCGHFGLNPRPPCHGEGRGFESHHPLYKAPGNGGFFDARACGVVLLERNGPTVRRGRLSRCNGSPRGLGGATIGHPCGQAVPISNLFGRLSPVRTIRLFPVRVVSGYPDTRAAPERPCSWKVPGDETAVFPALGE